MKIKIVVIGKSNAKYLNVGIEDYLKRLKRYIKVEFVFLSDVKNAGKISEQEQKVAEGEKILAQLGGSDDLILMDENGDQFGSEKFAKFLQKQMNSGIKNLILAIGGPYGFSEEVYTKAKGKISLSKMTFNHEMVRLFLIEQIYRGMTILRGEPYHHK